MISPVSHINSVDHGATPIPAIKDIKGWQKVPIQDGGEELVSIDFFCCDRIAIRPAYFLADIPGAIPEMFLRLSVAELLVRAANSLPNSLLLVVLDAWRPLEVQEALYKRTTLKIRARDTAQPNSGLSMSAETYAAEPSLSPGCPYPHSTGGSVDVALMDDSGVLLNMGTEFDDVSAAAATRFFESEAEETKPRRAASAMYRDNRRLLFHALTNVGFTNYFNEWWHFDFGNQLWAVQNATTAQYGKSTPLRHPQRI